MVASTRATTRTATHTQDKPKKAAASSLGAPSQRSQSSRKGKRAWRKNIDIEEVEEGLEVMRTEERVTGSALQKKSNDELFVIDVTADDSVRSRLPKYSKSALTSTKILAQRSAVPAVATRVTTTNVKRKRLTHEEKDRLLRMGKRIRRGPFNAVMDPTENGAGSALLELSEAAKQSGKYNVWGEEAAEIEPEQLGNPTAQRVFKAPAIPNPREHINLSAVPQPHEGTSYNPPVTAHQDLLRAAVESEERRAREAEELAKTKAIMEQARKSVADVMTPGAPLGMTVQAIEADEEEETQADEVLPAKKIPERKTKQERRKAEKRQAEKRAIAEKLANKRLLAAVHGAKALRKTASKSAAARESERREREQQALQAQLKKGLAGKRLGKHIVPEGEVDVQLGEDLSENLRALKPEGNLFKDRFLSLQQRALIEPRVPVLPKRKAKAKEYEKYAWKRFDREQ